MSKRAESRSSALSKAGKRSLAPPTLVSKRDTVRFNKTSSELGNTLVVLQGKLKDLEREIRNDQRGVKEFEDHLDLLGGSAKSSNDGMMETKSGRKSLMRL